MPPQSAWSSSNPIQASTTCLRVLDFGFRIPGFRFRDPGSRIRTLGSGFRVQTVVEDVRLVDIRRVRIRKRQIRRLPTHVSPQVRIIYTTRTYTTRMYTELYIRRMRIRIYNAFVYEIRRVCTQNNKYYVYVYRYTTRTYTETSAPPPADPRETTRENRIYDACVYIIICTTRTYTKHDAHVYRNIHTTRTYTDIRRVLIRKRQVRRLPTHNTPQEFTTHHRNLSSYTKVYSVIYDGRSVPRSYERPVQQVSH